MKKIEQIKKDINSKGYSELCNGVYLRAKEDIIEDQKSWEEEDSAKSVDFSAYEYWITTDDGQKPEGFSSIEEVLASLS
jgi:hypothetical protein